MDRDAKYDALCDQLIELTETFGEMLKMHMDNMNTDDDYFEQPMHILEKEQTQDQEDE